MTEQKTRVIRTKTPEQIAAEEAMKAARTNLRAVRKQIRAARKDAEDQRRKDRREVGQVLLRAVRALFYDDATPKAVKDALLKAAAAKAKCPSTPDPLVSKRLTLLEKFAAKPKDYLIAADSFTSKEEAPPEHDEEATTTAPRERAAEKGRTGGKSSKSVENSVAA